MQHKKPSFQVVTKPSPTSRAKAITRLNEIYATLGSEEKSHLHHMATGMARIMPDEVRENLLHHGLIEHKAGGYVTSEAGYFLAKGAGK